MDALLEKADAGEQIGYNRWQAGGPVLKAYSMLKNLFGRTGIIPEGMSATRRWKNQYFVAMHASGKEPHAAEGGNLPGKNQYRAPYWQLLQFAREAANENKGYRMINAFRVPVYFCFIERHLWFVASGIIPPGHRNAYCLVWRWRRTCSHSRFCVSSRENRANMIKPSPPTDFNFTRGPGFGPLRR